MLKVLLWNLLSLKKERMHCKYAAGKHFTSSVAGHMYSHSPHRRDLAMPSEAAVQAVGG